jgi:LPS sulfotransferase NodH
LNTASLGEDVDLFAQEVGIERQVATAPDIPQTVQHGQTSATTALDGEILVHLHNVGDVHGTLGDWVGKRHSGLWIEGFSISPQPVTEGVKFEYRAIYGSNASSAWVSSGSFCGTRGKAIPLHGLSVRLMDNDAGKYQCEYSATFVDGTESGSIGSEGICVAESFAPLEAFCIRITQQHPGSEKSDFQVRRLILPDVMQHLPSPHSIAIANGLSTDPDNPLAISDNIRFLFHCFTNRSGSNYLENSIAAAGLTPRGGEFFNAETVLHVCGKLGITSFHEYFCHIVESKSKSELFFGKFAAEHIALLIRSGILDRIITRSKFILLQRLDKLAQAVSLAIAEQTQQWAWYAAPQRSADELQFSAQRIGEHLDTIVLQEHALWQFFSTNGIVPIVIHYETFVQQPQAAVDLVAMQLGVPSAPIDIGQIELRKQATEINDLWRARFLSESQRK